MRQHPPKGQRQLVRENAEKQDKNGSERKQFTLPIKAAPCLIHVRLSSGTAAGAFADVSQLLYGKIKHGTVRKKYSHP